ncbi:hypothetical protein HJG60_009951 [Phyllostomus discolor]|uniref:Uncharacterized protein n=1 Tax=Phyllostomus discolor TaxID=89673 RepID=A0A834BAH3_9CHIR|nr:hypothetical protein HJG60_009951 [Phyllostomus discolor]
MPNQLSHTSQDVLSFPNKTLLTPRILAAGYPGVQSSKVSTESCLLPLSATTSAVKKKCLLVRIKKWPQSSNFMLSDCSNLHKDMESVSPPLGSGVVLVLLWPIEHRRINNVPGVNPSPKRPRLPPLASLRPCQKSYESAKAS